jgi:hypothetical protein
LKTPHPRGGGRLCIAGGVRAAGDAYAYADVGLR